MISNISSISEMSLVPFDCIWWGSHIEVVQRDNGMVHPVGICNALPARICNKCGNAGAVDESLTKSHFSLLSVTSTPYIALI
jgi:hypothetical protein